MTALQATLDCAVVTVFDVWVENAYHHCRNEDGEYDRFIGYTVLAKSVDCDGFISTYGYTAGNEDRLLEVCDDYAKVNTFVGRIIERGRINSTRYWVCLSCEDSAALPDYVTNPHRPEYN